MSNLKQKEVNIAIIGLGYVGLPLAIEFNKKFSIVAYDINSKRVNELNSKIDRNCFFFLLNRSGKLDSKGPVFSHTV